MVSARFRHTPTACVCSSILVEDSLSLRPSIKRCLMKSTVDEERRRECLRPQGT